MFSSVVALCIDCRIILAFAGQLIKSLRYATTCITFIRFHIDFKDTVKHIVIANYVIKAVFAVTYTDVPVKTAKSYDS